MKLKYCHCEHYLTRNKDSVGGTFCTSIQNTFQSINAKKQHTINLITVSHIQAAVLNLF